MTPLPIELTCNVTGLAIWKINGTFYTLSALTNGAIQGHNRRGANLLVSSPANGTEYICVSQTTNGDIDSNPAYILVAGKSN